MRLIFVEPSATGTVMSVQWLLTQPHPASVAVLLGPEGGWSASEIEAARAAECIPVSLGPLTLRAESMPVAALAALQVAWPR
jgi:16S rRNA (uracil1498-N3)-methyltransferase